MITCKKVGKRLEVADLEWQVDDLEQQISDLEDEKGELLKCLSEISKIWEKYKNDIS